MSFVPASGLDSNEEKLAEALKGLNFINEAIIARAVSFKQFSQKDFGWILNTLGLISPYQLYQGMAIAHNMPLETNGLKIIEGQQAALLEKTSFFDVKDKGIIPYKFDGQILTVYTTNPLDENVEIFLKTTYSATSLHPILVTPRDFEKALKTIYQTQLVDDAKNGLFYRSPANSAIYVISRNQLIFLSCCGALTLLGIAYYPALVIGLFLFTFQLLSIASIFFKLWISIRGSKSSMLHDISNQQIESLKDDELPIYSVLVPVYKEPEIIAQLTKNLAALDYPAHKLDIIILLEEDDPSTLDALKKSNPPAHFRLLIIPHCLPKTKPKACNFGLFFAKGKYLTIYDAEDRPDPDQLKKSFIAFREGKGQFLCFQAALNYYNRNTNFLTRMFTLEYSYWFDYMLPGLDSLNLPIPLGGTSNHFETEKLKNIGGWDPFNTTEDADLGIRGNVKGYRIGIINSTTFEEANSVLGNWLRQRSRWIKGYMQTWLVNTRHPIKMWKEIGAKNFISFHLLIGGTVLIFLTNLIMIAFSVLSITNVGLVNYFYTEIFITIALLSVIIGNALAIYLNMVGIFKRQYYSYIFYTLLTPFYWVLHSLAAYKALWQLFVKPFYWEKTRHGISNEVE
ncbi:MAG: glycosyltransferase [Parachlamydiales bacterium]|nr:glycosyltransferase [Parachlamydiales bacterium]